MTDVERSFERLLGRQPSDKEIQSLYRVKSALDLGDNDAIWIILLALESYDTLFRRYPGMVGAEIKKTVEEQRVTIAAIADAETRKAIRTLSDAVNRASDAVALRLTLASQMQAWGWLTLGMVAFGSLCLFVGYALGTGNMPWWAPRSTGYHSLIMLWLATAARAPAGWIGAIAGVSSSLLSIWHARAELNGGLRTDLLLRAVILLLLAVAFLVPTL
ncbi:hypothetical protein [Rugamonas apoptosis]|uniref:Uncharacterized protein n=1 Tax=Rugamonas apoptosis TaxID=2758570 RepID=A0A7W2F8V7_9BURK|nr:hypothetical protein [Rugamonas apoptosis]MBA5687222.1 hypothetical protein [Rugamonas apoptosis]